MKAEVTFQIDTEGLRRASDSYLATLWHVAQANPACPFKDRGAGQLAEAIGREIIRRFVGRAEPELWHHQRSHFDWGQIHLAPPPAAITDDNSEQRRAG